MKRRIRSIFLLMVVCMVGINGFQAYWLYTTYQLTASQFARTVRDALATVVQRQQVSSARQLLGDKSGKQPKRIVYATFGTDGDKPNRIVIVPRARKDSSAAPGHPHQKVEMTVTTTTTSTSTSTSTSSGSSVDTLARSISRLIINDWAGPRTVDLRQFASAYHAELRQRTADAPFVLDTLRLKPALGERAIAPPRHLPASYTLFTPPTLLNPVTDLHVRAAFEPPTSYVLRRMGGLLLGSGLLLALTTACFLLMLSTILKQKKLSDVKNDFINNMTHELKTPLATVSAAVEALQNFGALNDPLKTQTYLNISRTELQRLSDLVEKVLNIAVEEREQLELRPEAVPPAELVAEIVARHQLQAVKPVKFDVEVAPAPAVSFDRLHMGNVINNLIDNAIKYSKEAVTITIRGRQEPTGWHLTVADNGPGIEPGYQQAIFDRFFRVPTGNLHNVKGFGLGLYYVRQVVERHGGRIDVRSGLGMGSEFALWIPVTT